ncbi:ATP-binding protein [Paenibacillus hunanensis]|uniref:ATP-binding protein n=1 Tax=Paenibacillus hunanensis TaxID=539262 RepID=UPI00286D3ED0|nr:ATP-binding protein [Paenibacillus hunanensis]
MEGNDIVRNQLLGLVGMIVIFIAATSLFLYHWLNPAVHYPQAQRGVLNAGQWNFAEHGVIPLQGEWEFYPNQLLTPDDFKRSSISLEQTRRYLPVPGRWNGTVSQDGSGAGTYRLHVNVDSAGDYGLRVKKIRMSSRIYMADKLIGSTGQPSLTAAGFVPSNFPVFGTVDTDQRSFDIIIQVASFETLRGGLVQAPEFGSADRIMDRRDHARMADMVVITTLFVFGIYFAGMFRQWRREPYLLFFSMFCLTLGLFFSLDNEIILAALFPHLSFLLLQKLLFILPYVSIVCFVYYVRLYLNVLPTWLFRVILALSIVYMLLLLVLPNQQLLYLLWPGILLQVLVFGYIFGLLLRNRHQGARVYYILLGVFFLTISWIFAQTRYQLALDSPYYIIITLLLVVLSQSFLMTDRIREALRHSEQLAGQLLRYDQQKDEFLAKTSHELRTPLHGIINLSGTLLDNTEQPLQAEQRESVRLLHLIGRRLASLVNDILDMNRIRYGELQVQLKPVDLRVSAEFVMETLSITPISNQVALINQLPAELPLVWADENRLRQILHNLLENAIKYTEQGSIILSAERRAEQLAISVTDTGKGMDAEVLKHLFQPFFHYDERGAGSATGIGLGLSISRQLVLLQGGQLEVESQPGTGSRFTFTLPLADAMSDSAAMPLRPELMQTAPAEYSELQAGWIEPVSYMPSWLEDEQSYHVLIVDDELSNLKVAADVIAGMRHTYTAVRSGEAAREALRQRKPDLVLLDLMMPGTSGLDICREIRALHGLSELPVLMLTASGQTADMLSAFAAGANDILQKPFELAEFRARVQSLLSMKGSSEQALRREMDFLQAQITPHFLYNSMNALVGLSYKDVDRLRETIQHLTTYLRAKFTFVFHSEAVPLARELELVRAYLAIEQLRFGKRLQVRYDVDEHVHVMLPPLTLQPIVENAVRHGIGQKPEGGAVDIIVRAVGQRVEIMVKDDGIGMTDEQRLQLEQGQSKGVGIGNVNRRLQMKYGRRLDIVSQPEFGTTVTIHLTEVERSHVESDID